MKIKDMKAVIDKAFEQSPDREIEIYYKKKNYEIGRISQSGIIGTLYIEVGECIFDEDKIFGNVADR